MATFYRFELRTTDVEAARGFYAKLFGHDRSLIWPLHEQALARGARPHWLGYLGVDDVESTVAAFVARGGMRLGPAPATAEGGPGAVLRDPGGALLAVAQRPAVEAAPSVPVAWHVLNTNNVAEAAENYRALCGWHLTDRVMLEVPGTFHGFAWHQGGESVGVMADIADRPGVHPHWTFFFEVDALESAMALTRDAGGLTLEPITLASGERFCVCEDPQGAAFALRERRRLS